VEGTATNTRRNGMQTPDLPARRAVSIDSVIALRTD
jgi:hypothetical protein